jgi:hypothetical protein
VSNAQEAREIGMAIIRQAIEDYTEPPQSLDIPDGVWPKKVRQWLRLARSRARRIEANREDAVSFLFSPWFDLICEALDLDLEQVRDRILDKEVRR